MRRDAHHEASCYIKLNDKGEFAAKESYDRFREIRLQPGKHEKLLLPLSWSLHVVLGNESNGNFHISSAFVRRWPSYNVPSSWVLGPSTCWAEKQGLASGRHQAYLLPSEISLAEHIDHDSFLHFQRLEVVSPKGQLEDYSHILGVKAKGKYLNYRFLVTHKKNLPSSIIFFVESPPFRKMTCI